VKSSDLILNQDQSEIDETDLTEDRQDCFNVDRIDEREIELTHQFSEASSSRMVPSGSR